MNKALIAFMIPLNADAEEVEVVVQSIYDHFKVERSTGGVDPATLPASGGSNDEDDEDEEEEEEEETNVELDKNGLPWDGRIHAGTRTKNKDGSWKKLKNVDDKLVAKVTKQLLATVAANAAAAPAGNPPPPPSGATNLPPPPSKLPPPPAPKQTAYTGFVNFITTNHVDQGGKIDDAWLSEVLTHYGVADGSLQNAAHLTDAKLAEVQAWIESVI